MKYKSDSHFEKIKNRRYSELDNEPPSHNGRKSRSFAIESSEFRCKKCKCIIGLPGSGTQQRNHCPQCLSSLHLDTRPGDRNANCGSTMEAIAIWVRGEEWVLLHRCLGCGVIHANRIAPDDNETLLLSLAARPLGRPAFPLFEYAEVRE
ncbi:MAG: RNHCP domain-containing protein [Spirochaetia bacterium]|nr:RNHCP domain-containing protein [Spirochaetia bacterium]